MASYCHVPNDDEPLQACCSMIWRRVVVGNRHGGRSWLNAGPGSLGNEGENRGSVRG